MLVFFILNFAPISVGVCSESLLRCSDSCRGDSLCPFYFWFSLYWFWICWMVLALVEIGLFCIGLLLFSLFIIMSCVPSKCNSVVWFILKPSSICWTKPTFTKIWRKSIFLSWWLGLQTLICIRQNSGSNIIFIFILPLNFSFYDLPIISNINSVLII